MTSKALGVEGFRWFIGKVESRADPLMLGRLRCRIYNVHSTNTEEVKVGDLPWAPVLLPVFSASMNKVGISPTGAMVGTTVWGFFADGAEMQKPIIIGVMAGIPGKDPAKHDVSELAREINSLNKTQLGPEPDSAYNARYPYNKVFQTESGHVVELDDTPNQERIHVYHRSGTYMEINAEGRRVTKVVGDDYEIIVAGKTIYIGGNMNVQIMGNANVVCNGVYRIDADEVKIHARRKLAIDTGGYGESTTNNNGDILIEGFHTSATVHSVELGYQPPETPV